MKFKLLSILLACFILTTSVNASTSEIGHTASKGVVIKKFQAWAKYRDGDYKDAMARYKELLIAQPENAFFNYMMGKCLLAVNKYDEAITYFETAKRLDPKVKGDLSMQTGLAYHKKGDLNKALLNYNNYISTLTPRQLERDVLIEDYVNSCMCALRMKTDPVNVKITKLGNNINSDYDDASPGLTPDGKTLIFTSRRITEGIENLDFDINPNNDKMYISQWDDNAKTWAKALPAEGNINHLGHIGSLSLSHDGKTMFIFKNIPDQTKSGDIFYSELTESKTWSNPVSIGKPINSSYFESSACLSPDGNLLYFVSERKGGYGNGDIYKSQRMASGKWTVPENLKGVVNSEYDELGLYVHPDGKTIYFSSNGHNNMGGYDIFKSVFEEGVWSQPINMGYPINTEFDEKHFVLSQDGKTAYISSNRNDVFDIYMVDMSNYQTKKPVEMVTQYVTESGTQAYNTESKTKDTPKRVVTEITVFNEKNNKKIASFNSSDQGGDYLLKLESNEIYSIIVAGTMPQKVIATIKTNESGEYQLKISNEESILISVEKSWKQALLRIKFMSGTL